MSKLAMIKQYQYAPAAGGLLGGLVGTVGKFIGRGLGIIKPKVVQILQSKTGQAAVTAGVAAAAGTGAAALMKGARGASGSFGRRRGRGITARELRGYRKVARLLHKEGMVSKRARGRH